MSGASGVQGQNSPAPEGADGPKGPGRYELWRLALQLLFIFGVIGIGAAVMLAGHEAAAVVMLLTGLGLLALRIIKGLS